MISCQLCLDKSASYIDAIALAHFHEPNYLAWKGSLERGNSGYSLIGKPKGRGVDARFQKIGFRQGFQEGKNRIAEKKSREPQANNSSSNNNNCDSNIKNCIREKNQHQKLQN